MKATGWRPADTGTIQGDARVHESASGPVVAGGSSQKGWEGLAPAQSIPIEAVGHLSAEALAQGVGGKRPSPALSNLLEQTELLSHLPTIRANRAVPEAIIDALEGATKATQSELRALLIAIASPEERSAMLDHPSTHGPASLFSVLDLVSGAALDRPASMAATVKDPELRAQVGTLTLRKGQYLLNDRPLNQESLDQLLVLRAWSEMPSGTFKEQWLPATELNTLAGELRVRSSDGMGSSVEQVALRWKD
jgi:hypothetical protein